MDPVIKTFDLFTEKEEKIIILQKEAIKAAAE
jgi:hypothetical protein